MANENAPTQLRHGIPIRNIRQFTIDHLWLLLPILCQIIFGFRKQLNLLDFWWHLRIGDLILETGTLPRIDEFSFPAAGAAFVLQNWLAEVLYSLVYQLGGFEALIFFNTLILTAAVVLVYSLCLETTGRIRPAALSIVVTLIVLPAFSSVRPQVFSFFFFALFLWILAKWLRGNDRYLWLLPVAMLLWVNLHGAFVLGLGLIFLFLASETVRRVLLGNRSDTQGYAQIRKLSVVFSLTSLASLANPEFYRVYEYVLSVARDPGSQKYVTEWQTPAITRIDGISCFFLPLALGLLVLLYTRHKLTLTELSLFFGFAVFGLMSLRNGIWFALVAPTVVAVAIIRLPRPKLGGTLLQFITRDRSSTRKPSGQKPLLNLIMALLMLAVLVINSPWLYPRIYGIPLWDAATPTQAMDFIDEHDLEGNIFHPQAYGDFLIWRLWPQQRSFIDGRVHIFGEDHVEDYLMTFVDTCWEERLARHSIRYLFLSKSENAKELSQQLVEKAMVSPNWRQIYEDELSIIFEKVGE